MQDEDNSDDGSDENLYDSNGELFQWTPPEIAENYDPSFLNLRAFACIIDHAFLAAVIYVPAILFGEEGLEMTGRVTLWLVVAYFPVVEGLWGQSLGKFITKIKVVDATGRPPGVSRALMRTATRFLEVNPLLAGGIPAWVIATQSKWKQRLGDKLAGTFVIRKYDADRLVQSDLSE